jgi:hypothetical protein
MQIEERKASITCSSWGPPVAHHCTDDDSGAALPADRYTDCILAMLTFYNAEISLPRRDLVFSYRCGYVNSDAAPLPLGFGWVAAASHRGTMTDNDDDNDNKHNTWHRHPHLGGIYQHANTIKDPALRCLR